MTKKTKQKQKTVLPKVIDGIDIDPDLVKAIKDFESSHKDYLEEDGSLNGDGWSLLHDAEVNWGNDPKWHDFEKYHLQPRLEEYWQSVNDEKLEYHDVQYKAHWKALHPKLAKEYFD